MAGSLLGNHGNGPDDFSNAFRILRDIAADPSAPRNMRAYVRKMIPRLIRTVPANQIKET
jgi:uncharacterized protein (UPF0147 family)